MRNCEYMKSNGHLKVSIRRDGVLVGHKAPTCDPFHTTTVTIDWSFLEWVRFLFTRNRSIEIVVAVEGDKVAMGRWFRGQDLCEKCGNSDVGPAHRRKEIWRSQSSGKEIWCLNCYRDWCLNPCRDTTVQSSLHDGQLPNQEH